MARLPGTAWAPWINNKNDEWLTPPYILEPLGAFDLDPCSPVDRPWDTAAEHLTIEDDSLDHPWHGRVWLNPPYSNIAPFMALMARRGRGIALVFARTETQWWFDSVWPVASALLFLRGRVCFYRPDGSAPRREGHNATSPSVLVAYGREDADALARSGLDGYLVTLPNSDRVVDAPVTPSVETVGEVP